MDVTEASSQRLPKRFRKADLTGVCSALTAVFRKPSPAHKAETVGQIWPFSREVKQCKLLVLKFKGGKIQFTKQLLPLIVNC